MKLSVILRTNEFRGDHAADVSLVYEVKPGETVEQLAARIIREGRNKDAYADVIEIRLVNES